MADFVTENGFNFLLIHEAQEARGDADHGAVFCGARGKSVGFTLVDTDFGHLDACLIRQLTDHAHKPRFKPGLGIVRVNHLHAHAHLGHGLTHQKRNDRSGKAHDKGKDQKRRDVQALAGHLAEVNPGQKAHHIEHNAEHHHNGNVGQNKKCNTLHSEKGNSSNKSSGRHTRNSRCSDNARTKARTHRTLTVPVDAAKCNGRVAAQSFHRCLFINKLCFSPD